MLNKLTWATMKSNIDSNTQIPYFFTIEDAYKSNDPNVSDTKRYYVRQEIQSGVTNYCFIYTDNGSEHQDWDNNYKAGGIETL